ncbi:MAG: RagB/SusD family nutrient uptake outer membrane protein [Cyclobacteriaceae bacterium]
MKNIQSNILTRILAVALIIGAVGCQDKFLEETNPNQISTDSYWKTLSDLESGLVAVYASFSTNNIFQTVNENHRSDIDWPGWGRPNTSNPFFLQTFTGSDGAVTNKWSALYEVAFKSNQVIEAYEALEGTFSSDEAEERALEIYAEAKFFRGVAHWYLYNSFNNGKVIISDFVPVTLEDFYQPIRPADEVIAFVREDLTFAINNLPETWTRDIDMGRVTTWTAQAVMGKSFLYDVGPISSIENAAYYDSAAAYFKNIIDNGGFSLTPEIGMNFHSSDEFNSESIFEVSFSVNYKSEVSIWDKENTAHNLPQQMAPGGFLGGFRSTYPACWLGLEYRNEKMDLNDASNYVPAYDWSGNRLQAADGSDSTRLRIFSKRTGQSIALVDDMDNMYYNAFPAQKGQFNNSETAYFRKYSNSDIADSERTFSADGRGGSNIRLIRLADVYLMYAECLIKGGTDASGLDMALEYVNKVRKRSSLEQLGPNGSGEFPSASHDNITYDAGSLMNHLMYKERPLELASEGHAIRYLDLRRWGVLKQRFDELAVGLYAKENVPFVNLDGTPGTRWGGRLIAVATEAEADPALVDRSMPAANFREELHSYLPIPVDEETGNPELYSITK